MVEGVRVPNKSPGTWRSPVRNERFGTSDNQQIDESDDAEDNSPLYGDAELPSGTKVSQTFPESQFSLKPYSVSTNEISVIVSYDSVTSDEVSNYTQTLKDAGCSDEVSESKDDES